MAKDIPSFPEQTFPVTALHVTQDMLRRTPRCRLSRLREYHSQSIGPVIPVRSNSANLPASTLELIEACPFGLERFMAQVDLQF